MRFLKTAFFFLILFVFFFPKQVSAATSVPILTYHYVDYNPNPKDIARDALSINPDKFDAQMGYLSTNGFTPITLDTLYGIFNKQATMPAKPIVLTFDDGYENFHRVVYPILRKYNFHAVAFIPTGLMGKSYYMNWGQIKEIQASGLVTFEDHSITHANLALLNSKELSRQLTESKKTLESQTDYPVNFVAYPYGTSNDAVRVAAQQAGFAGGLGTWYGRAWGPSMNIPRIKVSGFWSIKEFATRL